MKTTKTGNKWFLLGMLAMVLTFGIVLSGCATTKAVSSNSKTDPIDYVAEGIAYAGAGKLDNALDSFTKEIAKNPTNASAYLFRGIVYRDKQEYAKALSDYAQVVIIAPNDTELVATSYSESAFCYWNQKDFKNAIPWYTKALALFPDNEQIILQRGMAYYFDGDYENAIKDGEKILALGSTLNRKPDKQCYTLLASAYSKLGNTAKAELYGFLAE
jgi:tetratricopeptide (TPR) repeat protein